MTTIVINEKTEEGRSLMNVIRALRKSSDAVVSIDGDAIEASERIPGLPYTQEERIAAIRKGEEDYAAGRYVTSDEMRKRHPRA